MRNIFLLMILGITALFTSCSNKVDFGEQYKKAVYIINSKELTYYASHDISKASEGHISVYVTGSELPQSDIRVSYRVDEDALNKYNKREYGDKTDLYFKVIPQGAYSFDTPEVIIKKGEPYGCLNFTINTEVLISDETYILPITLSSAEGAEVNESMHTILYIIQVSNAYAGNYISTYKEGLKKGVNVNKKAEPLSARKILLPLGNKSNSSANNSLNYGTDFYQVTVNEDEDKNRKHSLVIEPYLSSIVEQDIQKESYYDSEEHIFYIYYKIKDKYGEDIKVEEVVKMI